MAFQVGAEIDLKETSLRQDKLELEVEN